MLISVSALPSCRKAHDSNQIRSSPDVNFSTDLYIGNHVRGETAQFIGSVIGLSAEDINALEKVISEHDRHLRTIDKSDYAPYLVGILYQNENERYRKSIIDAIGYENYHKWFDYERSGMHRKLKSQYNFDDVQLEYFKKIVKDCDVEVRSILRKWISKEDKEAEVMVVIKKRDESLARFTQSDVHFEDVIMRSREIKY